ncbi:putative secreted protein [Saccharothrix espanaensis DSM 44229]|uniref:Putative secreted protein n=1 Tax=Saccharothrix espanaensis (strain ATCC 51144 / DSM 44229 / JCM 9112 / NBRC 15066 / NRRL 15764) TaxID=1179773 RepID=K0K4F9_SACES|nr:putative secreted protein [Saccharothrix espanaensis DSM 44229]
MAGLVVVLSGCSVRLVGTPVAAADLTPPTTKTQSRPTAVSLLGDLPTFDPCSLLDIADLKAFGTAAPETTVSLDYCLASLTTPGGTKLDVEVGSLEQLVSESEFEADYRNYRGGLRIAYRRDDTTQCARRLVFDDLVTLTIAVSNYSDGKATSTEMCNPADALATAAADRVLDKEAGHRTFKARSIGKIDACSVVGKETVTRVPGIGTAKVRAYPAGHQCRWSPDGTATPPRARVTFSMGEPTKPDGQNRTAEDVAGRTTTISRTSVSSLALCSAETAHIPVENGLSELAYVSVSLAQGSQIDAACAAVKALAAEVWSKLPQ